MGTAGRYDEPIADMSSAIDIGERGAVWYEEEEAERGEPGKSIWWRRVVTRANVTSCSCISGLGLLGFGRENRNVFAGNGCFRSRR